jgi:hypothetical protein
MPTLRQLATQVSESLSSQACSVQDLLDIADSLSLPLAGRDGGDSADSIAPIINDLVQIATVRGISLKESAEGYTPNASPTSTASQSVDRMQASQSLDKRSQHRSPHLLAVLPCRWLG